MKEKPIGEALRNAYRDVLTEPVPDKLQDLIKKTARRRAQEKQLGTRYQPVLHGEGRWQNASRANCLLLIAWRP
ncbi:MULTISPECIES: NepR family anti-sigma factor [Henriciella]|uniref:NepR family anti-sigma factor n=1 Tax=Henriciella TaxID=453849 RepID=UPI001301B3CD